MRKFSIQIISVLLSKLGIYACFLSFQLNPTTKEGDVIQLSETWIKLEGWLSSGYLSIAQRRNRCASRHHRENNQMTLRGQKISK